MKKISKKNLNKTSSKKRFRKKRFVQTSHSQKKGKPKNVNKNENIEESIEESIKENIEINIGENIEEKIINSLIKTIFNIKDAKRQLLIMGFDTKKISSSYLNEKFFTNCYKKLCEIENIINSGKTKNDKLYFLSKEYYKMIPHSFDLFNLHLYLIDSIDRIKKEICLLELIKSYYELEKEFNYLKLTDNDEESNFETYQKESIKKENIHKNIKNMIIQKGLISLDYNFSIVDKEEKDFKEIDEYLNMFSKKNEGPLPNLELIELYKLNKRNYEYSRKYKLMLWYGCETIHIYSLLKNNFSLPDLDAPNSAYSQGKGILFSQNAFNQLQKCMPKDNVAFLLLCSINHKYSKHIDQENLNNMNDKKKKYIYSQKIILGDDDFKKEYKDYYVFDTSKIEIRFIAKIGIPNDLFD